MKVGKKKLKKYPKFKLNSWLSHRGNKLISILNKIVKDFTLRFETRSKDAKDSTKNVQQFLNRTLAQRIMTKKNQNIN